MEEINAYFLAQLFDENLEHLDYDYIFGFYNEQWVALCNRFHKVQDNKVALVNPKFFYNYYAPAESS